MDVDFHFVTAEIPRDLAIHIFVPAFKEIAGFYRVCRSGDKCSLFDRLTLYGTAAIALKSHFALIGNSHCHILSGHRIAAAAIGQRYLQIAVFQSGCAGGSNHLQLKTADLYIRRPFHAA